MLAHLCVHARTCMRVCACVRESHYSLAARCGFDLCHKYILYCIVFAQEIDCAWDLHNLRESLRRCKRAVTLVAETAEAGAIGRAFRVSSPAGVRSVLHFSGHGDRGVLFFETPDLCAAPVAVSPAVCDTRRHVALDVEYFLGARRRTCFAEHWPLAARTLCFCRRATPRKSARHLSVQE